MKRLLLSFLLALSAVAAQAKSVTWMVMGSAEDANKAVYLLNSYKNNYDSIDDFINAATASTNLINKTKDRDTQVITYYTGDIYTASDSVETNGLFYLAALESKGAAYDVHILDVTSEMASYVYDKQNQEQNPGTYSASYAEIFAAEVKARIGVTAPEPGTMALAALGLGLISLRRRRRARLAARV